MKKKINWIPILILIALVVVGAFWFLKSKQTPQSESHHLDTQITETKLTNAIDIADLSTAEFIYNGIAIKANKNNPDKIDCHIAYNANVKVGIDMEDVTFEINQEKKTVKPILPPIHVKIATLDETSISYIPSNPNIELKKVIQICKQDAMDEANQSKELFQAAKENLQSVIEALLSPLLDSADYSIVWD